MIIFLHFTCKIFSTRWIVLHRKTASSFLVLLYPHHPTFNHAISLSESWLAVRITFAWCDGGISLYTSTYVSIKIHTECVQRIFFLRILMWDNDQAVMTNNEFFLRQFLGSAGSLSWSIWHDALLSSCHSSSSLIISTAQVLDVVASLCEVVVVAQLLIIMHVIHSLSIKYNLLL